MPARRTLLYLARDFPIPVSSSSRLRTFNWILHLSRRFDITLVTGSSVAPDASHLDALTPYCRRLIVVPSADRHRLRRLVRRLQAEAHYLNTGIPPEAWSMQRGVLRDIVQQLRAQRSFDVVFAERWVWGTEALASAPISVLDAGDLQAERHAEALRHSLNPLRRLLQPRLSRRFAGAESEVLSRAGLVLAQTAADRRAVNRICGVPHAMVLPPGLDTAYFAPRRGALDPSNIVFFASLEGPEQRDALQHLQLDLLPRVRRRVRNAHVTVIAPRLVPELEPLVRADPALQFADALEDPRSELGRAAVAVMPLRFGSGSRGHLSQLLAMGVPVIATPVAAHGLDVVSGDGLLVAPDGEDFADALIQVLLDSSLREDLARKGRETATTRLSMAATYDRMSDLLAAGSLLDA